jgi:hypothetical protein
MLTCSPNTDGQSEVGQVFEQFKSYIDTLLRESTFIMSRGGGGEDVKGGTEIFSGIKGGALKVLDVLKGGSKSFDPAGAWSVHSHHS